MPGGAKCIALNRECVKYKERAHTLPQLPLCTHNSYQQRALRPCPARPFPIYNLFLQRVVMTSRYYWSIDFFLPVQFFTSYSNLWFLG